MGTAADFFPISGSRRGWDVSWVYCSLMPKVSSTGANPPATADASVIWRACERKVVTRCGASPASSPLPMLRTASHTSRSVSSAGDVPPSGTYKDSRINPVPEYRTVWPPCDPPGFPTDHFNLITAFIQTIRSYLLSPGEPRELSYHSTKNISRTTQAAVGEESLRPDAFASPIWLIFSQPPHT